MMRTSIFAVGLASVVFGGFGCGVEFLSDNSPEGASNACKVDADCGASAICTAGSCFAKSGVIDEVLLEVVPEANSPSGGLSFLSMQPGVERGDRARDVPLPNRSTFVAQVVVNGSDVPSGCTYPTTGKPTIAARIEFSRTGAVGGVPILGLNNVPIMVDTAPMSGGWNVTTSLVPECTTSTSSPSPRAPASFRLESCAE